ncbi:hypothetical protein LXA47_20625 [Massilia sp. P8910]|uniref:hypothetical protein n=1 Tax=Massilia antarctica TaxID=2765360 RepID=UPI001E435D05|nr:hypothetical protein [Massilia antarctica]MCE3605992.1 hypothetical protein [Massilia antarctica]
MRTFSYWLCFALVVPAHVLGLLLALLPLGGIVFPGWSLFELLFLFSSLIPRIVAQSVPYILAWLLYLVMLASVAHRLWLFYARGERVPPSYAGLPLVLCYLGAVSLLVAIVVLVLSSVYQTGYGFLSAMIAFPATICIPWGFFLTELLSFRKRNT